MKNITKKALSFGLTIAMIAVYAPVFAAPATGLSNTMSRQKISETGQHVFGFTLPTALTAGQDVNITFPVGFDVSGATLSASTPAATMTVVGQTLELDYAAGAAAATTFSVTVDDIINPGTAANQVLTLVSDAGDTGEITVPIINDDQIVVTAKVDQTLFFDVRDSDDDDNAVGFGSLSSAAITYANTGGTGSASEIVGGSSEFLAGTNATGGYTINVEGETLTAGADTIDGLFTAAAPTAGQEEFGLSVDVVSGTGTVAADYAGTNYHLPDSGVADLVVTQTGSVATETYGVNYVANIDAATEAGDYATTLTYTMTANF